MKRILFAFAVLALAFTAPAQTNTLQRSIITTSKFVRELSTNETRDDFLAALGIDLGALTVSGAQYVTSPLLTNQTYSTNLVGVLPFTNMPSLGPDLSVHDGLLDGWHYDFDPSTMRTNAGLVGVKPYAQLYDITFWSTACTNLGFPEQRASTLFNGDQSAVVATFNGPIDFTSTFGIKAAGNLSIQPNSRTTYDSGSILSIDWENRVLMRGVNQFVFSWPVNVPAANQILITRIPPGSPSFPYISQTVDLLWTNVDEFVSSFSVTAAQNANIATNDPGGRALATLLATNGPATNLVGAIPEAVHATNADLATTATSATTATTALGGWPTTWPGASITSAVPQAVHATNADNATTAAGGWPTTWAGTAITSAVAEATHATSADTATSATSATSATTATSATYVTSSVLTNQVTNCPAFYQTWAGPTNTIAVQINNSGSNDYFFSAATNCNITGVTGGVAGQKVWCSLTISNSLAVPITNWWTGAGTAVGTGTTNAMIVAAGKQGFYSIWIQQNNRTNYLNATDQ